MPGVAKDAPYAIMSPPRLRRIWLDYARERADRDLRDELESAGLDGESEFVAFMVTEPWEQANHLNYGLKSADSLATLLGETLDVLIDECGGRPILIRSQLVLDFPIIEEHIRERPDAPILITQLHASVLATRARFFITNWMTTTLADARYVGAPTIEYSDYADDILTLFKGKSFCPEWASHFVNRDTDKLRETIRSILSEPTANQSEFEGTTGDPSGTVEMIAFGSR